MSRNVIETVMGAVVLVIAALFLFFAYNVSQIRAVRGYELTAQFERVDGIREGGDVRVSGIKVGSILSQTLDPKTYFAIVRMSIDPKIRLPVDTVAQIASSGLLGDKYMALVPGGADEMIPPGGRIQYTQPAMSLENLIGQYIFSQGQSKKDEGETKPEPKGK
jgi:phospholipid/cholesterol/gamma-HCH transport system substrate-binding protein